MLIRAIIRSLTPRGSILFLALVGTSLSVSGIVNSADAQVSSTTGRIIVSGTVVGPDGHPASGVIIGYKTEEEIRAIAESRYKSPTAGSGSGIAKMSETQKQAEIDSLSRIAPGMLYVGGNAIGQTDASGAFVIELPKAGTYIITAANKESTQIGSRQPVVLTAGSTTPLGQPIKLTPTGRGRPAER